MFVCPGCQKGWPIRAFPFTCSCGTFAKTAEEVTVSAQPMARRRRSKNIWAEGPRLPPEQRQGVCDLCRHWDRAEKSCKGICGTCPAGKADTAKILTDPSWACPIGRHSRPRYFSALDRTRHTLELLPQLPPDLTAIVGVARSGLAPATELAMALHLPLYALSSSDVLDVGHGSRAHARSVPLPGDPLAGKVLVVDDSRGTGSSLRQAHAVMQLRCPLAEKLYAVVYAFPDSRIQIPQLDFFAVELRDPHLFEWNLFNSPFFAGQVGYDFDGVLCEDQRVNGECVPKHLPRRVSITVITGRKERHRAATQAWLDRWGVVADLLMLPDGADEREPLVYSRHKAQHYDRLGLNLFVESCPVQAREIAGLTCKPVLCPAAGQVF